MRDVSFFSALVSHSLRIGTLSAIGPLSLLVVLCASCNSDVGALFVSPGGPTEPLTATEVEQIVQQAATALSQKTLVIAVVDREGNILAVFRKPEAPEQFTVRLAGRRVENDTNDLAVAFARTAAFFSNDQAPLSSRTVQFISREHFPPTITPDGAVTGVKNTPSGALWDIENTNRGCTLSDSYNPGKDIPPARSIDGSAPGVGIATLPGGVPLYKNRKLVGGVGVTGTTPDLAEFAAAAGASGFGPVVAPPGEVFLDGVRLPFLAGSGVRPIGTGFGDAQGAYVPVPDLADATMMTDQPQGSSSTNVAEGWLVGPSASAELNANEVRAIIENAVSRAGRTRAAIRLPPGVRSRMVIAVTSLDGEVVGLFRMPDATVFSVDVAVTKARNVTYFSSLDRAFGDLPGVPLGTAITNRTLRFGTQPFFPPGLPDSFPGPFVNLKRFNQDNPCTQGGQPPGPNQSGIVFFPGSAPLYRLGVIPVGGLGVSGDGVDQDDYVTAAGLRGYEPAPFLRADRVKIRGVRLPYLKFPRAPEE